MESLLAWNEGLPERLRYDRSSDPSRVPLQALLTEVLYK